MMEKNAVFSSDRKYRYALWRIWDYTKPIVLFIGLNPSTADEEDDDRTIQKCIGFAKRWECGGLYMANLFAFKSTKPEGLLKAADPIGPENDEWIEKLLDESSFTVGVWGNHGTLLNRGEIFLEKVPNLYYLKINKTGHPAHPLYLSYDTKLKKF